MGATKKSARRREALTGLRKKIPPELLRDSPQIHGDRDPCVEGRGNATPTPNSGTKCNDKMTKEKKPWKENQVKREETRGDHKQKTRHNDCREGFLGVIWEEKKALLFLETKAWGKTQWRIRHVKGEKGGGPKKDKDPKRRTVH